MKNTITSLDEISPNLTSVEASPTIKPAFCNPKKVIKIPIPTVIASFNEVGIELVNISAKGVTATTINKIPATITAAKACWNVSPIVFTMV